MNDKGSTMRVWGFRPLVNDNATSGGGFDERIYDFVFGKAHDGVLPSLEDSEAGVIRKTRQSPFS